MRRTEVDGLHVTWHVIQHHLIAIVAVENACDASWAVCFDPGNYPDLARARELHPELTRLWDAVRHEFWDKLIPPLRLGTEYRAWA
ncbi:hypothetical protein [Nocardia australiensis]|uniref:hypothetical protein n=1 Tax=Nocardia australiensis TaxID=2887191 RepID=UPI001D13BEBD|nr:hypothetical protein [Nocardia australiensis]